MTGLIDSISIPGINATGTPSSSTYLRGDGTWATPSAGAGSPGGSNGQIQYNNAGAFGGLAGITLATMTAAYQPTAAYSFNIPICDPTVFDATAMGTLNMSGSSVQWNNASGTQTGTVPNIATNANPYQDHVFFIGWNWANTARINTSNPSQIIGMENKYTYGGIYNSEAYWQFVFADGTAIRPFSWNVPWDKSPSGASVTGDYISFFSGAYGNNAQQIKFDFQNSAIHFIGQNPIYFDHENYAALQQRNHANTAFIALPYLTNDGASPTPNDALRLSPVPIQHYPNWNSSGNSLYGIICQGTAPNGGTALGIALGTGTGTTTALSASGNVGALVSQFYNASTAANAVCNLQLLVHGTAQQAFTTWAVNGWQYWSAGKNSSDQFEIAASNPLGTNTALIIDVNRNVAIGSTAPTVTLDVNGAIRTRAVAVASLPSAATAGAGARHFVTDSTQTFAAGMGATVAGGGTNKVPVYSDGASWIIG